MLYSVNFLKKTHFDYQRMYENELCLFAHSILSGFVEFLDISRKDDKNILHFKLTSG